MKKFLFGALALCAIAMSSCVSDEESPSVSAIRGAKAEQLKAVAALANAQAQAAVIQANADAKLKEAEAALTQAKAAIKQAESETAKAQAQADIERIKGEIEAGKIQAQADLIAAQIELNKAQEALQVQAAKLELEQEARIVAASTAYTTAVKDLIKAQKKLANVKTALMTYTNGLTNLEEALATLQEENNAQIAEKEAQIAAYKMYQNAEKGDDITALTAKIKKLNVDLAQKEDAKNAANYAYLCVETGESRYDVENPALNFLKLIFDNFLSVEKEDGTNLTLHPFAGFEENPGLASNDIFSVNLYSKYDYVAAVYQHKYDEDADTLFQYSADELTVTLKRDKVLILDYLNAKLADAKQDVTDTKKGDADALKALTDDYAAAQKATAEAKKAYDEAEEAEVEAMKELYFAAIKAEEVAKEKLEAFEPTDLIETNAYVEGYSMAIDFVSNIDKWVAAYEKYAADYCAAWHEDYKARYALFPAKMEAEEEYYNTQSELSAAQIALDDLLDYHWSGMNYSEIAEAIATLEGEIAELKDYSEELEDINDQKAMIEHLNQVIAVVETDVAAKEIVANKAKSTLDALIAAEAE